MSEEINQQASNSDQISFASVLFEHDKSEEEEEESNFMLKIDVTKLKSWNVPTIPPRPPSVFVPRK